MDSNGLKYETVRHFEFGWIHVLIISLLDLNELKYELRNELFHHVEFILFLNSIAFEKSETRIRKYQNKFISIYFNSFLFVGILNNC